MGLVYLGSGKKYRIIRQDKRAIELEKEKLKW